MRFIAGGTGRCGSLWFQQALERLGLSVTHEQVFTFRYDRKAITVQAGEVACAAAAHKGEIPTWWPVVHLIRDPLAVVRSYLDLDTFGSRFPKGPLDEAGDRFRYANTTVTPDMDTLTQTVLYVLEWDLLWRQFEYRNPYMRLHIEDINPTLFRKAALHLTGHDYPIAACKDAIDFPASNSSTERRRALDVWAPRVSLSETVEMLDGHPLEKRLTERRRFYGYV